MLRDDNAARGAVRLTATVRVHVVYLLSLANEKNRVKGRFRRALRRRDIRFCQPRESGGQRGARRKVTGTPPCSLLSTPTTVSSAVSSPTKLHGCQFGSSKRNVRSSI